VSAKKIASYFAIAALALGVVTLLVPTPAVARPPIRCTIEVGDDGCGPCWTWDSHLCRCVKIPSCKL